MINIVDDTRPIQSIVTIGGDAGNWWAVGREGVTKIVAYSENGQMAAVAWFAIYEGKAIADRVNGAAVEHVSYDVAS